MIPTIVILTFNSAETIRDTLLSALSLSDDIFVIDSGSTDNTVQIALRYGAQILNHSFVNYGLQRNWAMDNIEAKYNWQLHIDADEQITPELRDEIISLPEQPSLEGFVIPRYLRFMGRLLRHNLAPTFHMRLFRSGTTRCEARHYDQHFICSGRIGRLRAPMIDDIRMPLTEWTRRHNNWSDAEVIELMHSATQGRISGRLSGNAIEKKRFLRTIYNRFPLFVRPPCLFIYRYVIRFGFLDGKEGLIFCVLQTFWFRFLIDAKLFEASKSLKIDREKSFESDAIGGQSR
jgi:glycosyltransferase involved in cell wall biosynthesis